jgi:hypothetical protein
MHILDSLLNKILNKKVILVQNEDNTVNIYSRFKSIKQNPNINQYVNYDMTLKNGQKTLSVNNISIYIADLKGDNSHLNDQCLWSLNRLQHESKKHFNINIFGAYIFNPKF